MKKLITITAKVFLVLVILTSCEDEFVTPINPVEPETQLTEELVEVYDTLAELLIGQWYEVNSSKDSISLSFDGSNCHFYSINNGYAFDFSILYATSGGQILFEDNEYLFHDISDIEIIDDNNFIMTTSHLVDNAWIFTDRQYFTRKSY